MMIVPPTMPPRAYRMVWWMGVIGLVITVVAAGWFRREARQLDQARFDQLTHRWVDYLDAYTEKTEGMLRDLARVLSAHEATSETVWDEFMQEASPKWNHRGVVAIGYATNHLTGAVVEAIQPWLRGSEARERRELFTLQSPLDQPRSWNAWRVEVYREGVRPAAPFAREERAYSNSGRDFKHARFEMSPETAVFRRDAPFEPRDWPQYGLGTVFLDLNTDQVQDAAARGDVQISHRFALLQRTNGEPLLLATMLVPVSHPVRREVWEKLRPGEEHDEQLWLRWQINAGMIFACLDYETIIRDIQGETPPEVEVRIYSADQPDLTALTLVAPPSVADLGKGGATHRASFERAHRWAMYGDRWSLVFRSTPAFDRNSTRYRAWWAGGLGLATTGLFCWALSLQIRARRLQARRAAELREARDALQAAQGERERLCHDLHDGAIQSLYAIQLGFTRIGREMEALSPAAGRQLAAGRASLDAVIGELREFITDNRREENRKPAGGLDQVLNSLTERLRPESAASIELDCDTRASARLTPAQAVQLSAIAREALSNSMRHARARIITVRLAAEGLFVILEVNDDGSGFNLAGGSSGGIGLNTMRRRAEGLGTILDLKSAPGRGTRIRVAVPVAAESEPENGDDE